MKKFIFAALMLLGMSVAQADVAVTGNLGLTSDYRFRGISQSQNAPAVQGGIDLTESHGFYVGNWNSSVSSNVYTNGAGVESDLYAGWKKNVFKGVTVDVGSYNYYYPRATGTNGNSFDTHEGYVGLAYGPVSVRYNRSFGNYFGAANSSGTQYFQADVNYTLPMFTKVSLLAHAGRTKVANDAAASYNDYNVGAGYALPQGWTVTGKYYHNTDLTSTTVSADTVGGQRLYKNEFVVGLSKSF